MNAKLISRLLILSLSVAGIPQIAQATLYTGTIFYTNFTGGQNVNKVQFNYDDASTTFNLFNQANIASTNGADGIIFAPNGNLLIGGQGSNNVWEVNPNTGAVVGASGNIGTNSYHLALDPSGTKVYTSTFGGPLKTLDLPLGSGLVTTAISGSEGGITEIDFAPGQVFYVNGNPNGGGNVGTIDLGSGVTTRIFTGVTPAHGMEYDPYTNLMVLFGAGRTGSFDLSGNNLKISNGFTCDFDQGAVDGQGHAVVAGCGSITFLDYRLSGDITNPDHVFVVGGFSGIDDVAPLVGHGSNPRVPEPMTLALLGGGLLGLGFRRKRS